MVIKQITLYGRLDDLAVWNEYNPDTDKESKVLGDKITLSCRDGNNKLTHLNIKVNDLGISDPVVDLLDQKVEVTLEDVRIIPYIFMNRAQLSIKAASGDLVLSFNGEGN